MLVLFQNLQTLLKHILLDRLHRWCGELGMVGLDQVPAVRQLLLLCAASMCDLSRLENVRALLLRIEFKGQIPFRTGYLRIHDGVVANLSQLHRSFCLLFFGQDLQCILA